MFLKCGWLRALLFLTLLKISKCEEGGEEEEARLGNATGGIVEAVLRGAFYDADREVGLRGLVEDDGDGEDDDVGDISQEVPVPALSNSTLLRSLRSIKDGKTSSKKKLSSQKKEKKKSSKKSSATLQKYNAYLDAVYSRMNLLLKSKKMDPLRVNLYSGGGGKNKKKAGGGGDVKDKKKSSKKKNKNKNKPRLLLKNEEGQVEEEVMENHHHAILKRSLNNLLLNASSEDESSRKFKKNKGSNNKPTRGLLTGLSTLKRSGNSVIIKKGANVRIIRSNFVLGPVQLEIDNGNNRKTNSSTKATTPTLNGLLEIKLSKGAPTKIKKLKVFPPKNVRVSNGQNLKKEINRARDVGRRVLENVARGVVSQNQKKKKQAN